MPGLAALYGQSPQSLKELYQLDPKYQLAQQALQSGTSTAPAQGGWGEGLARVFQGALGGKMARDAKSEAESQQRNSQQTLTDALSLGKDLPAETKQYQDGTSIDWEARPGNQDAMIQALSGNKDTAPIGMGIQGAMMDAQIENSQKANEPITPYQQATLKQAQDKLDAGSNGISYTMPDGTEIQIGGTGKGGNMKEYQAQASSRATLLGDGLKTLEKNINDPAVSPLRMAVGDTVKGSALGDLAATKMQSDPENIASAGRDAALEGMASSVTGAGVTKDQFTRFTNMLPKTGESDAVQQAKFDNAYNFLLNQTNIAGPVADQIKQHILERTQTRQGTVGPASAAGSSTVPQGVVPTAKGQFNAAAAKAAGYTDAEIQQFLQGQ